MVLEKPDHPFSKILVEVAGEVEKIVEKPVEKPAALSPKP
jgi:hypothetical protein